MIKAKDPIDRLEKMYDMFTTLVDGVDYIKKKDHIEYVMDEDSGGKAIAVPIKKIPEIGIVDVYMEKGAESKYHFHEDPIKEVFLVYDGLIEVINHCNASRKDFRETVGKGGVFVVEPGMPHVVRALKKSRLIAATMPTDKKYPNGK